MALNNITRIVYGLLGLLYVLVGAGSMLLPTGWLPRGLADDILPKELPSPFVDHLLQEFGTVVLALGLAFLWYASRREQSRSFHWAMTLYFLLDALIHWIGPQGLIGSWPRGTINSIPFAVMFLLGVLQPSQSRQSPLEGGSQHSER
jgi:hypothetical protein